MRASHMKQPKFHPFSPCIHMQTNTPKTLLVDLTVRLPPAVSASLRQLDDHTNLGTALGYEWQVAPTGECCLR